MSIHYNNSGSKYRLADKRLLSRWLEVVAADQGFAIDRIDYIFCSSEELLAMNRQYLGHDYYTDVITFDYSDRAGKRIAGDVFIDVDTVHDNARCYGASRRQEMHRILAHGLLHLCGQKDKSKRAAGQMRRKEERALGMLLHLQLGEMVELPQTEEPQVDGSQTDGPQAASCGGPSEKRIVR